MVIPANDADGVPVAGTSEPEPLVISPKQVVIPDHGLIVFESRHAPGFHGELKNAYSKFHLVIAGRAQVEIQGRSRLTRPNTLFHISAGVPHRVMDLPNDPVSQLVIHYRPELLDGDLSEQLSRQPVALLHLGSPKLNQTFVIRSLFREMLFEQDARQVGWQSLLRSRLTDMAVRTLRMAERQPANAPVFTPGADSAERVANYAVQLKSRFYRQETLEGVARSVYLSRRRFSELFRRVTGKSWHRYVQELRMEHAGRLLSTTDRSVIAVAFESGFEDLSHFHHCFKVFHGCTPLTFRVRHANNAKANQSRSAGTELVPQ